ncbi:MAG: type II CAAX prenyl endopeptidase Rce1 family protein [Ramlibacter sp.]
MTQAPPKPQRSAVTPAEALFIVVVCFGWAILGSTQSVAAWGQPARAVGARAAAVASTGITNAGLLSIVVTELVLSAVALAFLAWRRYDIPGLSPQPTPRGLVVGVALYAAGTLAFWLLTAVLNSGTAQEPIGAMVRDASVSVGIVVFMAVVNGAYEEIFLLGVLGRGLRGFGQSIAVGVPLLVRLLYHTYQGPVAASAVCLIGMVWGFHHFRSQALFPVVFAHVIADVVPFVWH